MLLFIDIISIFIDLVYHLLLDIILFHLCFMYIKYICNFIYIIYVTFMGIEKKNCEQTFRVAGWLYSRVSAGDKHIKAVCVSQQRLQDCNMNIK